MLIVLQVSGFDKKYLITRLTNISFFVLFAQDMQPSLKVNNWCGDHDHACKQYTQTHTHASMHTYKCTPTHTTQVQFSESKMPKV